MPPITSKPKDPQPALSMMPFFVRPMRDCMGSPCRSTYRPPEEVICSNLRRNIGLGVGATALGGVGTFLLGREAVQARQNNSPSSLWLAIGAGVGAGVTGLGGMATLLHMHTYRMTMAALCENRRARETGMTQLGRGDASPMERAVLSIADIADNVRSEPKGTTALPAGAFASVSERLAALFQWVRPLVPALSNIPCL